MNKVKHLLFRKVRCNKNTYTAQVQFFVFEFANICETDDSRRWSKLMSKFIWNNKKPRVSKILCLSSKQRRFGITGF